jgi:hypothetical protein
MANERHSFEAGHVDMIVDRAIGGFEAEAPTPQCLEDGLGGSSSLRVARPKLSIAESCSGELIENEYLSRVVSAG